MLLNCVAGEDSYESLELQGEQTSEYNNKISSLTAKSLQMMTAVMKLKDTCSLEEKL